jgi:hypothetical protein
MRRWSPGATFTTAIGGESWYVEDDDALTVAVVLDGSWGTNQPDVVASCGPWGESVNQLWIGRVPKSAFYIANDLFDPPVEGEDVPFFYWEWARAELFDKPHRAVANAVEHGEILSRTPVCEIPGVRQVSYYGLIRYEGPRDARAVRVWQQARLRAEVRHAAARRRWRNYRDAETWHPGSYKGAGRKYEPRKRDPR